MPPPPASDPAHAVQTVPTMIPELTLTGLPRERGRQHGEELRGLIAGAFEAWFEHLAPRTDPARLVAEITNGSGLRAAVARHAPDLLAEVWGIAEGSGQPFESVFAWQLIDECWWYLDEADGSLQPHGHCSAMAVSCSGRGLLAQTQDLYRHMDGSQVMLRYFDESGLEILAPSVAGLLALNGVNSAGLAVGITTLDELAHSAVGVGSGFLVPMLLRCRSVDEVLALLERVPVASGNSFLIASRDRGTAVEVSSEAMAVTADGERALHTNHALALEPVWNTPILKNSRLRLEQLDRTVRPDSTLAEIAAMYATGAVCKSRDGSDELMSVGTMIFELADDQACHYAPGPLDTNQLVTYRMRSSGGAAT